MAQKLSHTAEELELLTEEELAGLEDDSLVDEGADENDDDDGDEDPAAAAAAAAAAAKPDLNPGDGGDEDAAKAATDKAAKDAADKAPTDAAAAAAGDDDAAAKPVATQFPQYEAPADAKVKLTEIEQQRDALAAKFDEGELTAAEFRAQSRPLEEQRDTLKEQMLKASLSQDALVHTWSKLAVPTFLEKHPEYAPGTPLYVALDGEVRRLQAGSDNPFDPALLAQADATIKAQMRKAMGMPDTPTPAATPPKKDGKGRVIPPTLAHLPSADLTEETDGGEFAFLDRLSEEDPGKFEAALGKLTEDQRERYLAI